MGSQTSLISKPGVLVNNPSAKPSRSSRETDGAGSTPTSRRSPPKLTHPESGRLGSVALSASREPGDTWRTPTLVNAGGSNNFNVGGSPRRSHLDKECVRSSRSSCGCSTLPRNCRKGRCSRGRDSGWKANSAAASFAANWGATAQRYKIRHSRRFLPIVQARAS